MFELFPAPATFNDSVGFCRRRFIQLDAVHHCTDFDSVIALTIPAIIVELRTHTILVRNANKLSSLNFIPIPYFRIYPYDGIPLVRDDNKLLFFRIILIDYYIL